LVAWLALALALAAAILPAAASAERTLFLSRAWVDERPITPASSGMEIGESSVLKIRIGSRPPVSDPRYMYKVEGVRAWSPIVADSTIRVAPLPPGLYKMLVASARDGNLGGADTLRIALRVGAAARSANSPSPVAGRVLLGLAVAVALLLAIALWERRRRFRQDGKAAVAGRNAVRGTGPEPRDSAAPGRPGRPEPGESHGAPPNPGPAAARVEAGAPAGTTPREKELERELTRLRERIEEVQRGSRELRRMNEELNQKCEFLERSNGDLRDLQRKKQEVLATLVHDIKNPAAAVQSLAELLQSYDLNAEDRQRFITGILETSARILKLSQELSEVVASEIRDLPLRLEMAPLPPLLERVCAMNKVLADRKQIVIRTVIPPGLPRIQMDTDRIEEVLDNLLGNAIKYSPAGSPIEIAIKSTSSDVTIEVIDHGPGIPENELRDSFQLARMPSKTAIEKEGSSGLGLWIVRKIVEAHLGLVYAKSEPGRGTTVSIMLPTLRPIARAATRTDRSDASE
jgi:signal transduction histidine kinase